jgi:hypothetical protein
MTRRMLLPNLLFVAEVLVIGLAAAWLATVSVHSTAVSLSSGVTAALIANALLPCPCHPKAGRR